MLAIDLSNHTALVTGATGELGRAIVRTLAQAGADVAIHYHSNQAGAEKLLAEIKHMGRHGCIVKADITDQDQVKGMAHTIEQELGHVDIVVANAYIHYYNWSSVLDCDIDSYLSQYQGTVLHNLYLIKAFLPHMKQCGYGRYVAMNTVYSIHCGENGSAYSSAKRAMDGVLRTLAREVGSSGITVNQVFPGWIKTEKERNDPLLDDQKAVENIPLGHRGSELDIANAVAFLASDRAAFITGALIPVCGGECMPGF